VLPVSLRPGRVELPVPKETQSSEVPSASAMAAISIASKVELLVSTSVMTTRKPITLTSQSVFKVVVVGVVVRVVTAVELLSAVVVMLLTAVVVMFSSGAEVERNPEPLVVDSASPVVVDSTSPVVVDSARPVVVDSTSPVVVDSSAPVVVDTQAAVAVTMPPRPPALPSHHTPPHRADCPGASHLPLFFWHQSSATNVPPQVV